jgi:hypothetical protein
MLITFRKKIFLFHKDLLYLYIHLKQFKTIYMQINQIKTGSYIRNSGGFTFHVTLTEKFAHLYPIDDSTTTSTKVLPISVFNQLIRNHNFVTVTNPNNALERILTKSYGSRLLTH